MNPIQLISPFRSFSTLTLPALSPPLLRGFPQATQEVVSKLPLTTPSEFNSAVAAAKDAFPAWRDTPLPTRLRVMFKFQQLIRDNWVSLSNTAGAAKLCGTQSNSNHDANTSTSAKAS